jgi:hypothetical protein
MPHTWFDDLPGFTSGWSRFRGVDGAPASARDRHRSFDEGTLNDGWNHAGNIHIHALILFFGIRRETWRTA